MRLATLAVAALPLALLPACESLPDPATVAAICDVATILTPEDKQAWLAAGCALAPIVIGMFAEKE